MNDKLPWAVKGQSFADGSRLSDWVQIYASPDWHWQYDTHEMTFAIYEHDDQYWKLYCGRFVEPGATDYTYDYGGVACRVVLVEYLQTGRSPHSAMLKRKGEEEWIRTNEFDPALHKLLRSSEHSDKYGAPYESLHAA